MPFLLACSPTGCFGTCNPEPAKISNKSGPESRDGMVSSVMNGSEDSEDNGCCEQKIPEKPEAASDEVADKIKAMGESHQR